MDFYKRIKAHRVSFLFYAILFALSTGCHALPFGIGPKVGTLLPINVVVGRTATAYYTVKNNTQSLRNDNYVLSLPQNVTQVTTGGTYDDTCGATFNLAPTNQAGDSCTLQLAISGPVSSSPSLPPLMVCFPGGKTCAGTPSLLSVTQTSEATLGSIIITPATTPLVYLGTTEQYTATGTYSDNSTANITTDVTWHSSDSTIATIASTGLATGINIGSTAITATLSSITSNASILNVVSTPVVTATLSAGASTTNNDFNIIFTQSGIGTNIVSATLSGGLSFIGASSCTVNQSSPTCSLAVSAGSTTGAFTITPTLISGPASVTSSPDPLVVTVTLPLFSYVSDNTSALYQCPINPANGSFMGACSPLINTGSAFSNTSGVAFNTFSTQNYAYVGDSTSTLWQCPLSSGGGFSAACTALTNTGTAFSSTRSTTFNTFSGSTYAYVSDDSAMLWQCPMNASGGFSSACMGLTNGFVNTPFSEIFNTTFNTFSGSTYAYIADHSFVIWRCPMDIATGGFSGSCTPQMNQSGPFAATLDIKFNTFNGTNYAYVADDSDTLWQCPINPATGGFALQCIALQNSTTPFYRTSSVAFNTFEGVRYAYVTDESRTLWQCPMNEMTGRFSGPCTALQDVSHFGDTLSSTFYIP